MALVAHSRLPTFQRLRDEGFELVDPQPGASSVELHVGLLNMMPDAALQATERQFMRLIAATGPDLHCYVHPFTIEGVVREGEARVHVETFYEDFARLRADGLDALIITGANPKEDEIADETFWESLVAAMDWAREHVSSVYMSCLASHAAFKQYYGVERTLLPRKLWGVYSHRVVDDSHPLVAAIDSAFDMPHSRLNDVPRAQLQAAGLRVLIDSEQAGVLAAVDADGLRSVYFQGHPEYDVHSLLKEYKREVGRFVRGEREDYPPFPENYFAPSAAVLLAQYGEKVREAVRRNRAPPPFPEDAVASTLEKTWTGIGETVFENWLALIERVAASQPGRASVPGVEPTDGPGGNRVRG